MDNILLVIVVPVALAFVKTLLREEIDYWGTLIYCFFNRPFDHDGDPDTHDWCLLFNPGNGEWDYVSLTFHFSFFKGKNGVFVHRYDPVDWRMVSIERVSFSRWRNSVCKAHLVKEKVPSLLFHKI